jgi:ankyrin repeat protein
MQFSILILLAFAIQPFEAVRHNDSKGLMATLTSAADANQRNAQGATLLMQAALHGDAEMLRALISKGADVNLTNPQGATALHWAAGDPAKVKLLLEAGANANAKSNLGRTPLTIAAATPGNIESVRLLLKHGADPKLVDQNGDGPLGNAATSADVEMIRVLLAAGANLEERGARGLAQRGLSPLTRAAAVTCEPCVAELLAAGADPNALSEAPREVKAGLQSMGQMSALFMAVQFGSPKIAARLLTAGAKVDQPDWRGFTPLIMAAAMESQDPVMFNLLLAHGAKTDLRTRDGESAADWILKFGPSSPLHGKLQGGKLLERPLIEHPEKTPTPAEAVQKALALILPANEQYFKKSGCPGCHNQLIGGMLAAAAKAKGIEHDQTLADKQLFASITVNQVTREGALQRVPAGGAPQAYGWFLWSWKTQGVESNPLTDAMIHDMALLQSLDGSFGNMLKRTPLGYSTHSSTALAIRAMRDFGSPGRRNELFSRTARALAWLNSNEPGKGLTEEINMRNLGRHWAGAKADPKEILAWQNDEGAWSQRPGLAPDAYATGQSLYTLAQIGFPVQDARFQKGIQWLLRNQAKDGSWYVRSRSVKFQPFFETGFPYGHDQWISSMATGWAGLALTEVIKAKPDVTRIATR